MNLEDAALRLKVHVEALSGFGSRYWNRPGFDAAMGYAEERFREWGHSTRRQPFEVGVTTPQICHNLITDRTGAENAVLPEVIVGAHLDSIAPGAAEGGPAPGADDNASGCAIVLETARLLSEQEETPKVRFRYLEQRRSGFTAARRSSTP
jgi:acetylornithine deacetylase/succinyl-diaminopimelate desuccinylase-like protein